MWPQVPEDINSLSIGELAALANQIRDAATAVLTAGGLSADTRTELNAFMARRDEIKALHDEKVAALAADQAQEQADAAALAALAAETALAETQPVVEPERVLATVGAPAPVEQVITTFGNGTPGAPVVPAAPSTLAYLQATKNVGNKAAGDFFDSWAELANAAVERSMTIGAGSTDKISLAMIRGSYDEAHRLTDNKMLNVAKFDQAAEVMAAFCAPATPHYNVACMNVLRRPVFNSLPGFEAPRMQVSIMPSPDLADITTGYGQWIDTDDDDPAARKNCVTITCGSPTTYKMYGVYKCITIKNLLAMSYPELVEAWLNRLGAAHSRLGETLLLDAMGTEADEVDAAALGYGAAVSITSTILNYLALYQETQRWDLTGPMEGWAPRWVLWGMKMDIMRRRRTDGKIEIPSDADIERMFANVGVNIHWFIDTPSWAVAIPAVATGGGALNLLPSTVQILLAPRGKFALMDKGELSIGVTGDHIYRDNTSNSQNQFTMFWENFEGVVNTTTCPAHILNIPACWNGVQIDDIVINCQGGDEVGYQS